MHEWVWFLLGTIFVIFIVWATVFEQDRYLDKVRKFDFKDREDDRIFVLEAEITRVFNIISQLQTKITAEKSMYKRIELARKINKFGDELVNLQKKRIL